MNLTNAEYDAIEARLDAMLLEPSERANVVNEADGDDVQAMCDVIALIIKRGARSFEEMELVKLAKAPARRMEVRIAEQAKLDAQLQAIRRAA